MRIVHRASGQPSTLGLLPAAFNPPTKAHLALAEAALVVFDEVALVMPERLPHKDLYGPGIAERIRMLEVLARSRSRLSVATTTGGLFDDIARESREHYPEALLSFVCGRDAAVRILNWDYGSPEFVYSMLTRFTLHVASRHGEYEAPHDLRHAIHPLRMNNYDECSSTGVREAIARGIEWRHLVPDDIHPLIEEAYRPR